MEMIMPARAIGLLFIYFILSSCASAPELPTCDSSVNLTRINPEWVSEVADFSIPWDNTREEKEEKIKTIETLNKNIYIKKDNEKKILRKKRVRQYNPPILNKTMPVLDVIKDSQSDIDKPGRERDGLIKKDIDKNSQIKNEKKSNKITPKIAELDEPSIDMKKEELEENDKLLNEESEGWFIPVASYSNLNFAERHKEKLVSKNYPVYIKKIAYNNKTFHRVILGPKLTLDQANSYHKALSSKDNDLFIYSNSSRYEH